MITALPLALAPSALLRTALRRSARAALSTSALASTSAHTSPSSQSHSTGSLQPPLRTSSPPRTARLLPAPAHRPSSSRARARARACAYSTAARSSYYADASHPKGLYLHPLSNPTPNAATGESHYAVSLLSTPPSSAGSPSIMAFLAVPSPSDTEASADSGARDPAAYARAHPDAATPNPAFWALLHSVLKEDIVRRGADAVLTQEAELREDGWAHIADERQPLMPGRIPTPDAILSTIAFTGGKLQPESYEVNHTYRPITREEGWTVLRDVWLQALERRLKAVGI